MLDKILFLLSFVIASSLAETPLARNRAPYGAAGFRPHTPFNLPGEHYLPADVDDKGQQQQFDSNHGFAFEITKQRVDFAGQEIQSFPVNEPQNEYGPPTQQPDFVDTQGLPNNGRPSFNPRRGPPRRNNGGRPFHGRPNQIPQSQPNYPQQPQPNYPQQPQANYPQQPQANFPPQRLPNPATDERFEPQQNFPDSARQPYEQYGAPINVDPRTSDGDQQLQDADELQKQFALDALNAAVDNYNRLQENNADKIAQGQYFVVNPDNSIQKVQFTTKQNEQEAKLNDFTAELKYTRVGELKDPLYKYNADGQLVRIVKK